jgi:hypothetical protein
MASNGVMLGNTDYSYIPLGWTCQSLLNTATLNLGYDVAFPGAKKKVIEAPVEEPVKAEVVEEPAAGSRSMGH